MTNARRPDETTYEVKPSSSEDPATAIDEGKREEEAIQRVRQRVREETAYVTVANAGEAAESERSNETLQREQMYENETLNREKRRTKLRKAIEEAFAEDVDMGQQ